TNSAFLTAWVIAGFQQFIYLLWRNRLFLTFRQETLLSFSASHGNCFTKSIGYVNGKNTKKKSPDVSILFCIQEYKRMMSVGEIASFENRIAHPRREVVYFPVVARNNMCKMTVDSNSYDDEQVQNTPCDKLSLQLDVFRILEEMIRRFRILNAPQARE